MPGKEEPRRKHAAGFTLLEIMVALTVLSISLVVLLGLRNKDIALAAHARELTEATLLARQKVTDITITGFPNLGEETGDFGEEAPKYRWRQEVRPTPFEAIRELSVQVIWENNKEERSVNFTSYLFDPSIN